MASNMATRFADALPIAFEAGKLSLRQEAGLY
jgi:hypothetical protein